jgi:hypothetical protein
MIGWMAAAMWGVQALAHPGGLRLAPSAPLLDTAPKKPLPALAPGPPDDWGLLTLPSQAPLFINRLHFVPGRMIPMRARQWEVGLTLNHVNIWAQMPGYFFDGEWTELALRLFVGLGWGSELGISLPAYRRSGGFLDGFIMGFHRTFGFTQSRRDRYPMNRLRVETRAPEGFITRLGEADAGAGLGNPTVHLRQLLGSRRRYLRDGRLPGRSGRAIRSERLATAVVAELAFKVPLGSIARQFATDGMGLLLGLGIQQAVGERVALYASSGVVWAPGTVAVYSIPLTTRQKFLSLGLAMSLTRHLRVVLQYLNQDGMADPFLFRPLNTTTYEFGVGVQWQPAFATHWLAEAGIIENGIHDANTPDFGVHLAIRTHRP